MACRVVVGGGGGDWLGKGLRLLALLFLLPCRKEQRAGLYEYEVGSTYRSTLVFVCGRVLCTNFVWSVLNPGLGKEGTDDQGVSPGCESRLPSRLPSLPTMPRTVHPITPVSFSHITSRSFPSLQLQSQDGPSVSNRQYDSS